MSLLDDTARFLAELSAGPTKGEAKRVLEDWREWLGKLSPRTREQLMKQAQDIMGELDND